MRYALGGVDKSLVQPRGVTTHHALSRPVTPVTLASAAPDRCPLCDLGGLQGKSASQAGESGAAVDLVKSLGLAAVALGVDVVSQG